MNYSAIKYNCGKEIAISDYISQEVALQIIVNENLTTVTMCSPTSLKELITGLLYGEDIIHLDSPIEISISKEKILYKAKVLIDEKHLKGAALTKRSFLSVSSCGICGKTELDIDCGRLTNENIISFKEIFQMFKKMNKFQEEFEKSGGVHAAAAFSKQGQLLAVNEDIGRHNAVDKVVGSLIMKKKLKEAAVLLVSGRVSYEIVLKAFRAKIPVLAAVSAPSSLAVDYAKEFNITLLGFCRENKGTCYSTPYRIKKDE